MKIQISQKCIENNLIEIKDIFRENYEDQIIMHMIIINHDANVKFFIK